jgi:hypothetical protein
LRLISAVVGGRLRAVDRRVEAGGDRLGPDRDLVEQGLQGGAQRTVAGGGERGAQVAA